MSDPGAAAEMDGTPQESCSTDVAVPEMPHRSDPVLNGQVSSSGISILDRLIKTCPVWLQLCMGQKQAVEMLSREASGVFLVTRDVEMKCMVLWVHFSEQKEATDILRCNIREEKTMMYLEGSMLVFKDIFKLVSFYCVSRDILPSPLKLPHVISKAQSLKDLEVISNLGTGFWDSSIRHKRGLIISQSGNVHDNSTSCSQHGSQEASDSAWEIEISVGDDRLWFVDPIFIEECSNMQPSGKLPLINCDAKHDLQLPRVVYRRPPPPPPPPPPSLHKPPLPSLPPSAPPQSYKASRSHSPPVGSPMLSSPRSSSPSISKSISVCPGSPPTESLTLIPLDSPPPSSELLSSSSPPESPKFEPLSLHSPDIPPPTGPLSLRSPPNCAPTDLISLNCSSTEPLSVCSPANTSPTESSPSFPDQSATPQSSSPLQLTQTDLPTTSSPSETVNEVKDFAESSTVLAVDVDLGDQSLQNMRINSLEEKKDTVGNDSQPQGSERQTPVRVPPAVPRRRQSGKSSETKTDILAMKKELQGKPSQTSPDLKVIRTKPKPKLLELAVTPVTDKTKPENKVISPERKQKAEPGQKAPPVPPPRRNKLSSRASSVHSDQRKRDPKISLDTQQQPKTPNSPKKSSGLKNVDMKECRHKRLSSQEQKGSDSSLNSPTSDRVAQLSNPEPDSYSTSSAEEDTERPVSSSLRKSHSFMLDRAKNRLSIVAISNVFTAFMSADRKLQKRITELAHDKDSYFGNLVQDYKAYSLEMMAKQSSSTEMLQEIRLMMTQLKSYLVQSTELKSMVDYTIYTDDKIDTIVEAALCKCVLKPLKSPIECYLREIHNKDGSLRLLTENQLVIQDTTTTDLGVTTSVPDSGVMEKILQKFVTMHKTYSPEKKITYLLKSCKLIYDSMATGNPGKPHGADDFLPVLMYVLARCDLVALLQDVEYMMELMDPALQLGEGSYYLTTTYGALEHIKNYDKITVTRQLSMEVQDSIHRWERRRTLNKARVSRSSIQDFITISFEELDSKTGTLATKSDTSVAQVLQQCAEKFEVSDPENYGLFVLVNERCLRLADDAFPQQVKSSLLKNEQKLDFHFLYKTTSLQDTTMKELDFL
ncbi:ras and Rab interactor 3 isoform X2 [Mixophyes fleayi]|uniref:ras and Rab interactor 3 isoform X2 n=1 Tax=Mixophyes fleayi TaxID=3061075 RepID=UPI003F4D8B96